MNDNVTLNEKLIENISIKNTDRIPSLTFGKVIQNYDEEHPKKVKVKLRNFMGIENNEVWADILTSYAGDNYGKYTVPEVDSEVVVAFVMNDRNFPIVVGNVWSPTSSVPADTTDKNNYIKHFSTKAGNVIKIDDTENKTSLSVKTVKGLNIIFNDEKNIISVFDEANTNKIDIDFENKTISLDAKENIVFKISGTDVMKIDDKSVNITTKTFSVNADSKIEFSGGQVSAEGTAIDLKSKGNLNIKANGNMSAEATGIAKVKGSLLNLN